MWQTLTFGETSLLKTVRCVASGWISPNLVSSATDAITTCSKFWVADEELVLIGLTHTLAVSER